MLAKPKVSGHFDESFCISHFMGVWWTLFTPRLIGILGTKTPT